VSIRSCAPPISVLMERPHDALLEVEKLDAFYGASQILHGVDLTFAPVSRWR
jgi:hypothetical protein